MMLEIAVGQHSRAGGDGVNQDFHGALLPGERLRASKGVVLALADGIGSSAVSQIASAAAVRGFLDDYYASSEAWSVRRAAQCVLSATNSWLHAQNMRGQARFDRDRGYVCTFSALVAKGRELHLLHVGDSRIYRVHPQALEQLTQDHRIHLSAQESYLSRALGVESGLEIDYQRWPAAVGEVYLLATDGAYEHLDATAVQLALALYPASLDDAARHLVELAQARGSQDDATVQLLRVDALPEADISDLRLQRQELAMPPVLAPRDRFEGYTIERELHASSRSHVYLATDDESGRQVALKLPSIDLRDDPGYLDRFLLEEWVARRIDSPHVLKACSHDRPRQHLFVVMEYLPGRTLRQWMTDHPRPDLDEVRALVEQLARGLQAFHGKEMLHRDLRPENVMIDHAGTARIMDFASTHVAGLAEGSGDSMHGAMAGALQYLAPEHLVAAAVDARADLFSLALLCYQMLTGQLPYGLQIPRLRQASELRRLRYTPVQHFRPDLPRWVDAVLRKALHPDSSRRQQVVSEFVQDLRAPGPEFVQARALPVLERHPVVFWQCTAALLLLLVIVQAAWLARLAGA